MIRTAFLAVWLSLLLEIAKSGHGLEISAIDLPLIGAITLALWLFSLILWAIGRSLWNPPPS